LKKFATIVLFFLISICCFANLPDEFPSHSDYMRFLEKFPAFAEKEWHSNFRGVEDIGYFGSGGHDDNQIRSLSNFIFVYCLLASEPDYNPSVSGVSRETLIKHALDAIRYFTASHVTGEGLCADFRKWGEEPNAWLSSWLISVVLAGANLIWDELGETEKDALKRVVVYDANFHLKQHAFSREYFASESLTNAIYGEMLAYAACSYPQHPNANRWLLKSKEFFMNTFSVKQDENNGTSVDGRRVKDWVYTTNAHPDFTIECHGAYQFDYNACPLHILAWSYYAFISQNRSVPESLFHHFLDVWNALKKTHLYKGRFAYLQGKDWARHVYGLYFIMPVLVLVQNEFNDADARLLEQFRFDAFQFEQSSNGGLFTRRFVYNPRSWHLIYITDCYANMGLAYLLHKYNQFILPEDIEIFQQKVNGSVESKYCEFIFARTQKAFISFSWRHLSGEQPLGLFVPGDDYMVEWEKGNLVGYYKVVGYDMNKSSVTHNEQILDNGFVTTGCIKRGYSAGYAINQYISFTGLSQEGIAVVIDYTLSNKLIYITEHAGLSYYLPNDIFNSNKRDIFWQNGKTVLNGVGGAIKQIPIESKWINIDDKLGIISVLDNYPFTIKDTNIRNSWMGQLNEEICYPLSNQTKRFEEDDVIRETCLVLLSGARETTEQMAEDNFLWLNTNTPFVKALLFKKENISKIIIANFSMDKQNVELNLPNSQLVIVDVPELNTIVYDVNVVSVDTKIEQKSTTFSKVKNNILFNPSNPDTWIPYRLSEECEVKVSIYNVKGELIRNLNLGMQPADEYLDKERAIYWDGCNKYGETVSSGIYFYAIQAGSFYEMRKLLLIR